MLALSAAFLLGAATPAWYDRNLAGYRLAYDARHSVVGVHDVKRGYYLLRDVECDGAVVTLTLTRDRNVVNGRGYLVPGFKPKDRSKGNLKLSERPLRSLKTGRGVGIGMTRNAVHARLGAPTGILSRNADLEDRYLWRHGRNPVVEEHQSYTFRAGRLIEIEFYRDASP